MIGRFLPTLAPLGAALGKALLGALRDARPHRYAWPAAVFALLDLLLRAPPGLGPRHALEYGLRSALMALIWGALGGLLGLAARRARAGRSVLAWAAFGISGLAALLLLALSVSHLAYFLVNGRFATPALLRAAWTLRVLLIAYLSELPTITVAMLGVVGAIATALVAEALRSAKHGSPQAGATGALCIGALSASVALLALTSRRDSLEFSAADAGALQLLVQASLEPRLPAEALLRGASRRRPWPVPILNRPAHARNVLLILTESVRSDAMCSDPGVCPDEYIDAVAGDRVGLTRLRTQSPGTFGTCMVLWTGLEPDAEYPASHRAPFLWEVARAAGYHTAYVSAQSAGYLDFGKYIEVSGADYLLSAEQLQPDHDITVGADDERAMAATLAHLATQTGPWYAVLHLSNTHAMYRTDPSLQPHQPQSSSLDLSNLQAFRNRYLNAIALQRRNLADFIRQLRALPNWDDTLVIFLSDHGEPLGDHGQLIHRDSLFESSMRIPGWVLAGGRALSDEQRRALLGNRERFVYTQDIHATILDALGVWEQRQQIPADSLRGGRSVLRVLPPNEPIVAFANISGVWAFAVPHYGLVQAERKLIAGPDGPFHCYDLHVDPGESHPQPDIACGPELRDFARRRFPERTEQVVP